MLGDSGADEHLCPPTFAEHVPLEECKELEGVVLPAKYGDIEFFRKMPKLKFLTAEPRSEPWWLAQQPAAAFWKKLDEGKQK